MLAYLLMCSCVLLTGVYSLFHLCDPAKEKRRGKIESGKLSIDHSGGLSFWKEHLEGALSIA